MQYLVIIPVRNEEKKIAVVVKGAMEETGNVLVIDDGSTDSTCEIVKRLGVECIKQPFTGKGAALRAGFRYALDNGYEWVITMDGDGQHDYREIPKFVATLKSNNSDMIIGSRMNDVAGMPLSRLATNKFMSWLISGIIGSRIPDTQCGYRAIRRQLLESIVLRTKKFDTESEIIFKSAKAGFRISTVPVSTIYNGSRSSINKFADTLRFARLVLRTFCNGK